MTPSSLNPLVATCRVHRRPSIKTLLRIAVALGLGATAQAASAAPADEAPISTAQVQSSPAPGASVRPEVSVPKTPGEPMTTQEQIAAFLGQSPTTPWPDAAALDDREDAPARQVHGQVGVAVGTGGYRSAYMQGDIPIGRNGTLSLSVQETQFGRGRGYAYGNGYGHGYGSGYGYGGQTGRSFGLSLDFSGQGPSGACRQRSWERAAPRRGPDNSRLDRCPPGRTGIDGY